MAPMTSLRVGVLMKITLLERKTVSIFQGKCHWMSSCPCTCCRLIHLTLKICGNAGICVDVDLIPDRVNRLVIPYVWYLKMGWIDSMMEQMKKKRHMLCKNGKQSLSETMPLSFKKKEKAKTLSTSNSKTVCTCTSFGTFQRKGLRCLLLFPAHG